MQKISGTQMLFLMTTFNVGMSLMAMISPTVQAARQDAWISIGVATVASMSITYLSIGLSRIYSDKTFIQCFKAVFSPFLGIPIVIIYGLQWVLVTGIAVRQIADFAMPALQLYETPTTIVLACILLLSAYATGVGGIESLARCSEIITPLVLVTMLFVVILTFRFHNLENLLPIVQPHLGKSLFAGAVPSMSFLTQSSIVMLLYPHLADKKAHMAGVWGTGIAGLMLLFATMEISSIFGPTLPAQMWNPFFMLSRYISIADFIQNIDAIIVVIWFFSAFIRVALYAWAAAEITSELSGMNGRLSVLIISVVAFIIALLPSSIVTSTVEYPKHVVEPFVLPVLNIGLPLLGLVIAALQRRFHRA